MCICPESLGYGTPTRTGNSKFGSQPGNFSIHQENPALLYSEDYRAAPLHHNTAARTPTKHEGAFPELHPIPSTLTLLNPYGKGWVVAQVLGSVVRSKVEDMVPQWAMMVAMKDPHGRTGCILLITNIWPHLCLNLTLGIVHSPAPLCSQLRTHSQTGTEIWCQNDGLQQQTALTLQVNDLHVQNWVNLCQ